MREMRRFILRVLARTGLMRWGAPVRSLRRALGWRPSRQPVTAARNILVIRPDEIGDLVMTAPFLRELRRAAPKAHITLIVNARYLNLVQHCPYVDAVHGLNFSGIPTHGYQVKLRWRTLLFRWKYLRGRRFDLVLLPRRDADWYDSEFVAYLVAGSAAILGHRDRIIRNTELPPLFPPHFEVFTNPEIEHEVLHNLRFLRWCGADAAEDPRLELWLTGRDRAFAEDWLESHLPHRRPLVVCHPTGGRSRLKQWPIQHFSEVFRRLSIETDCDFLVVGGEDEQPVAQHFKSVTSDRIAFAFGSLTLRHLSAVLETAVLFIGCDSGPMHLAAAAGTPVIGVFGSTSEQRFRPWRPDSIVVSQHYPCSPDVVGSFESRCQTCLFSEPRCLTELTVESVLRAARSVILGAFRLKTE